MSLNISILIPTKNRVTILIKTLNYYEIRKFNGAIIIFDSSNLKNHKKLLNEVNKKKYSYKINIIHIVANPFIAMSLMVNHIINDYVVYSGDDDFLIVENLRYFINFLDTNPNYFGVNGNAFNFSKIKVKSNIRDIVSYKQKQSMNANSILRLKNLLNDYSVPLFSIVKKKQFLNILKYVSIKKNIKTLPRSLYDEYLLSFLYVMSGKIKFINKDHLIRIGHKTNTFLKPYSESDIKPSRDFLKLKLNQFLKINGKLNVNLENDEIESFLRKGNYKIKKGNFYIKELLINFFENKFIFSTLIKNYYRQKIFKKILIMNKFNQLSNINLIKNLYLTIKSL